jgi:hypothetical protein
MAGMQQLGQMTPGLEKLLLLSGAMLIAQVWLYLSGIVISFSTHGFASAMDHFALAKGLLLLILALFAFKKTKPVN